MEYYTAMRINEPKLYAIPWLNLTDIMWQERKQMPKNYTYISIIPLIYSLLYSLLLWSKNSGQWLPLVGQWLGGVRCGTSVGEQVMFSFLIWVVVI